MTEEEARAQVLAPAVSRGTGVALGTVLGAFGGPVGVVLGQVTGYAVGEVLAWVASMAYAPLEGPKVEAALAGADDTLSKRADEQLRRDGFFDAPAGGRPPIVEIFEGAVRAAARDYEQRKATYLGRFWANLAYDEDIDLARGAFLLRLAEELTYRQLVLLAIFTSAGQERMRDRLTALNAHSGSDASTVSPECAAEMQDLANRNLLGYLSDDTALVTNTHAANEGRFAQLDLARIRPADAGVQLVRLLSLNSMPELEQEHVLVELGDAGL